MHLLSKRGNVEGRRENEGPETWHELKENKDREIKNLVGKKHPRVVPLLSTRLLCSVPLPPPPLLFPSSLTDEAARAPSHPSVLSLINQTIRLQLQLQPQRR